MAAGSERRHVWTRIGPVHAMLTLNGLTRSVNGVPVLNQASLEVAPAKPTAFVGLTRAEADAIARLLAGVDRPQAGTIRLGGADIASARKEKGRVIRIGPALPPASGQKVGKLIGAEAAARAGLSGRLNGKVSELSAEQRMRLAILQAIAARPGLLILDAPASGLAGEAREGLASGLAELVAGFPGVIVLLASGADEALGLGGDVVVLDRGAVVQAGSVAEVSTHPVNLAAAMATSWPTLNTLDMMIRNGRGVLADGSSLQLAEGPALPPIGSCTLAFHPEDVTLERASPGCIRFVVRAGEEDVRGGHRFLNVTFADAAWLCPLATVTPHAGARLNAFVDRSRLMVFNAEGVALG